MSVYVTRDIWKYSNAVHGARLVILAIGDSADKDFGISRLKQQSIATMTRLSVAAVREAIRALEDEVEIETRQAMKGQARINVYRVLLGDYGTVVVDPDELPVRLLEPFSTPEEIAARRSGPPKDDRQNLAVVPGATTARNPRDDRQISALHKEEPVLDPVETREAKNASLVAPVGAERERLVDQLRWSLTEQLGVGRQLTRSEHGAWGRAIGELVDVGATAVEVTARCAAYRTRWPEMALTPMALVRHWSLLGGAVDLASPTRKVEDWIANTALRFDLETAHELLDDRPNLDDEQRARYHKLIDETFAAREAQVA